MKNIDYEKEVKKVYPDAKAWQGVRTDTWYIQTSHKIIAQHIWYDSAWKQAYNTLSQSNPAPDEKAS